MKRVIGEIVAYVFTKLSHHAIPLERADELGVDIGMWITDTLRANLGRSGEKIETVLQEYLGHFVSGVYRGADYDDKE